MALNPECLAPSGSLLLQISTNVKNKPPSAQKTLSASTSRVHSAAQVCLILRSDLWMKGSSLVFLLRRVLFPVVDPEPSPLAAASVVGAVMVVVVGGAASLLLLVFCYRRYDVDAHGTLNPLKVKHS